MAAFESKSESKDDLPPVTLLSRRISSHIRENTNIPDLGGHFLDVMKTIEQAERIIEQSKEPFWGNLIKKLYLDGFTIDQIEEAFKRCNQSFKWKGQICIWYQESKPTCIQQLQFANGDGNPQYVKSVIQSLIEQNCKKDPTPPPPQMNENEEKQNQPQQEQPQQGQPAAVQQQPQSAIASSLPQQK